MTNTTDYSGEYLYWDNTEAVTVSLKRSPSNLSRSVATAFRDDSQRSTLAAGGIDLQTGETRWSIPNALLTSGDEIKDGDTITDGTDTWTVRRSTLVRMGSSPMHWECACVKQV